MRRGDYKETRAVRELSAAEEPGPAGLLDIIYCVSTRFSMQEVRLNTHASTIQWSCRVEITRSAILEENLTVLQHVLFC